MVVLVTCKNEEDPIKNDGARVLTSLYVDCSDSAVSGGIPPKFEVIQAFMFVFFTWQNEDPMKMKR